MVDDNLIYMERCFAPIMDSLFCGKATAVATVHRTVAKSRLSSPLSEYHTKKKNHTNCYFQSFKKNGPLPSAILAAAAIHGLSPGLKNHVAVPDQIIGLTLFLDLIDRGHSLTSLFLPPAALGSLAPDTFLRRLCCRRPLRVRYLNAIPKQKSPPFWGA